MKKIFHIIVGIIFLSAIVISSFAADNPLNNRVDVYYFHGNFRCATCYKLEQYSKEAIEANFKNELVSGKLLFRTINTDERANEHFINDYQLYTKSLIISLVKDGKEVKSKNLVKIWDYVGNKQKFYDYVAEEIRDFLREI